MVPVQHIHEFCLEELRHPFSKSHGRKDVNPVLEKCGRLTSHFPYVKALRGAARRAVGCKGSAWLSISCQPAGLRGVKLKGGGGGGGITFRRASRVEKVNVSVLLHLELEL